jgi:hypothetical protein
MTKRHHEAEQTNRAADEVTALIVRRQAAVARSGCVVVGRLSGLCGFKKFPILE